MCFFLRGAFGLGVHVDSIYSSYLLVSFFSLSLSDSTTKQIASDYLFTVQIIKRREVSNSCVAFSRLLIDCS